jgi:VanZ family protein
VAPPLIWAGIILVLSSLPALPTVGPRGTDKLAHFAVYAVLGALCAPPVLEGGSRWPRRIGTLAAILLFAGIDEAHQLLIRGRFASFSDWMADAAGAAVGLALAMIFHTRKRITR